MTLPCARTSWATSALTLAPGLSFPPFTEPVNSARTNADSALAKSAWVVPSAAGCCARHCDEVRPPNTAKKKVTMLVEKRFMFHLLLHKQVRAHSLKIATILHQLSGK